MKISILCPSNRKHNAERMLQSICKTWSGVNTIEVVFRIDCDQKDSWIIDTKEFPINITTIVAPSTFPDFGALWNDAYKYATGKIIQMAGDDLVYQTQNWDEYVVEAFKKYPDNIVLVWCQDHDKNQKLATHGFVHRSWIEKVGYFTPPYGLTFGNDDWVFEIAKSLDRLCYLSDVLIEHVWERYGPNKKRMWEFKQWSGQMVYSPWGAALREHAIRKLEKELQ